MRIDRRTCFALLLACLSCCGSTFAGEFFIRDGDRVVFLGDSITEQRLYTTYIEAYALTRYPHWKLWFRNVGWGGDTSWLRQRSHPNEQQLFAAGDTEQQRIVEDSVSRGLARDVLPLRPTAVTVKFGMNDHSYQAFREDIFKAYTRSQTQIAKSLQDVKARVAFLTPQPIEEKRPDPDKDIRNQSLRRFSDGLREVAEKSSAAFVDQFDPYMALMLKARTENSMTMIGGGDAVHPGPAGHTIMAWTILKQLGADPLVSRAGLDATRNIVVASERCKISNLQSQAGAVSFERLDQALPMPIDARAEQALKLAPVLDDLNRYELRVTGLREGQYEVLVDGEPVSKVSAGQLAQGWNMANIPGPIMQQSQEVLKLVFGKNDSFFNRWRGVQLFDFPAWAKGTDVESRRREELERLDNEILQFEQRIETARKPKTHLFTIKPVLDGH